MTSAIVAVVVAVTLGITIWRYETAQTQDRVALSALRTAQTAGQLVIEFQEEQAATRQYLISPSAATLRQVNQTQVEFNRPLAVLRRTPSQPTTSPWHKRQPESSITSRSSSACVVRPGRARRRWRGPRRGWMRSRRGCCDRW